MWAEWVGMTAAMCSPMALPSMPPPPASWRITGVLVDAQAQPDDQSSKHSVYLERNRSKSCFESVTCRSP